MGERISGAGNLKSFGLPAARPTATREGRSGSPAIAMKLQILSFLFFRVLIATAEDADPFVAPVSPPENPEEAALVKMLERLGPRSKGLGLRVNDDRVPAICVFMHENPDLSALRGMPARAMEIMGSNDDLASGKAMDLAPLSGMPLETLWIWKAPVTDLSPLKTVRLKKLLIMGAAVTDLSPVKDLPLIDLDLWATCVSDISPLKGMRLKHLNIDCSESARVRDLTPLEGMELETLKVHAKGMDILRSITALRQINSCETEDFWSERDGKKPESGDSNAVDPSLPQLF